MIGDTQGANWFEDQRKAVVEAVETARDAWDEDALAKVIAGIGAASVSDLDTAADDGHAVFAAVQAWAPTASYATTRFYFEGPQSILKRGGFNKPVAESLEGLAATWSGYLQNAMRATRANSFSIAVGFPFGVSLGLSWGPPAVATQPGPRPNVVGDDGF